MTTVPRFIQISTLSGYPSVLLNRDDSGLAKRIPFGGFTRTRVSSQCRKRHLRTTEDLYGLDKIEDGFALSVRSRKTYSLRIVDLLIAEGLPQEIIEEIIRVFQENLYGKKKGEGDGEKKDNKKSIDREEVVVLGEPEIRFLTENAREISKKCKNTNEARSLAEKFWKDHRSDFLALKFGAGIDAALFGRFVSGDAEARIDAAVHVAHSFTVHEETFETDYFTAVDDLVETGSGHINSAELTSGLFYNYAVVDVPQLISNTGQGPSKNWREEDVDRTLAGRIIKHLIHLFTTVSPGAKLGATAPYSYADFLLVEMGERQPRTLANAFAEPVPLGKGNLLTDSLKRIEDYVESIDSMYGPHEARLAACRLKCSYFDQTSVPDLAEKVEKAVSSGLYK